jgi:hypothetical protein
MKLDLTTSIQMARIAAHMYERSLTAAASNVREDLRLSEVSEFRTRRVRCMVGLWRYGSRATIVVAFRGSSNGSEWANNAHLAEWRPISPVINGLVHPGFIGSLADVWPSVEATIQVLTEAHRHELSAGYASGRSIPVCMVGHSRGGALAVLAGLRALTTFLLPVNVYTFGAPRVGTSDFAKAFSEVFKSGGSAHWRFECRRDPVPVFPFVLQAMHTGSLAYLTPGSTTVDLVHSERHPADRALRCAVVKPRRHHRMASYLEVLSSAVTVQELPAASRRRTSRPHQLPAG